MFGYMFTHMLQFKSKVLRDVSCMKQCPFYVGQQLKALSHKSIAIPSISWDDIMIVGILINLN